MERFCVPFVLLKTEVKELKKVKSFFAAFLCAILLISSLVFALPVSAAEVGYGNLYFIVNNENYTAELSTCIEGETEVVIPGEVYGYTVTSIAPRVFYGNTTLETVSIPDSVNTIGLYAFAFCSNLKSVSLGENVTVLADSVFMNCTSLQNAQINCNIEKLPNATFSNCESLIDVSLSDSIIEIGNTAFMGCSLLENLPIDNITKFGSNCFLGTGIKNVEIADGVTNIPWMCFGQCSNLTSVVIPKSVSSINETAFYDIMDRITIYCYYDSYAYQYAIENSIPYVLLDGVKLGDASGDGSVNINDVTTIQRYLAELETLEGIYLHAADANQDGTVDIADATAIQMYLAEYEMDYPIGEVMTQ